MPDFLDNVDTSDDYTDGSGVILCGFDPTGNVRRINFDVYNQPVFATFFHYTPGQQNNYTSEGRERRYNANTVGIQCAGVAGVKFRSAVPGSPAIVHGERVFETDPDIAYGSISPSGIDSSGGVVPVGGKPVFYDDNIQVGNTLIVPTLGEIAFNAGTDFGVLTGNDFNVLSAHDINLEAAEDISLRTTGPGRDINLSAARDLNLFGSGNVDLSAGGTLTINGGAYPPPTPPSGTPGIVKPETVGMLGWNFDPAASDQSNTLDDGRLYLQRITLNSLLSSTGMVLFVNAISVPTTAIGSLWSLAGDTVTLVDEISNIVAVFSDYLYRFAAWTSPQDLDGEMLIGFYAHGGTMPEVARAGKTYAGMGVGPGISLRGHTYSDLGTVTSMPSSIDLSTAPVLPNWPWVGFY